MTLEELRKGNKIGLVAVMLTVISVALTILIKTIVEVSGTTQRVVAIERAVENVQKELAVVREDVKHLLEKP